MHWSDDWFGDRSKVEKAIAGALKGAINDHGPITKENLSSAAKRIYGTLKGLRKDDPVNAAQIQAQRERDTARNQKLQSGVGQDGVVETAPEDGKDDVLPPE